MIQDTGEYKAIELLGKGDVAGAISSLEKTCNICLTKNSMPKKDEFFCERCKIEALLKHLNGENHETAAVAERPVEKKHQKWMETKVKETQNGMIIKQRITRTTTRYRIDTIVKEEEIETYYQFSPNGPKWRKYEKRPKKIKRHQYIVNTETKQ
jgi:hypothetical protein